MFKEEELGRVAGAQAESGERQLQGWAGASTPHPEGLIKEYGLVLKQRKITEGF